MEQSSPNQFPAMHRKPPAHCRPETGMGYLQRVGIYAGAAMLAKSLALNQPGMPCYLMHH
jgi:hypothetical protein